MNTCEQCEGTGKFSFGVKNREDKKFEPITQMCEACGGSGKTKPEPRYVHVVQNSKKK